MYADELATQTMILFAFQNLEMDENKWAEIKNLCDHSGIELVFDIFGEKSLSVAQI